MRYILFVILLFIIPSRSSAQSVAIDSLEHILSLSKEDTTKARILRELNVQWMNLNLDTAVAYGIKIIDLSEKLRWHKGLWVGYHQAGYCSLLKGEYGDALYYLEKAIQTCDMDDVGSLNKNAFKLKPFWKIKSLNSLGLAYVGVDNYAKALEYHLSALKIAEENNVEKDLSGIFINIANAYNYESNYAKALEYYFKALKSAEEESDTDDINICLANIGVVFSKQKDYAHALEYYFKALQLAAQQNDKNLIASCMNNIGQVYGFLKDYNEALNNFFKALQIADELNNNAYRAAFMASIGSTYIYTLNYKKAEKYLVRALEISKQTGQLNYTMQIELYLGSLYERQRDFEKALKHFEASHAIKDTLFTREKNNEINSKVLNYEFDKKQALLKAEKDIQIQKQKTLRNSFAVVGAVIIVTSFVSFRFYKRKRDAQFKQSMAEQREKEIVTALRISEAELKALRLQINPHFLNNTLQSIQQFISEHQPEEAEAYLENFSKLMRAVLENSRNDEIPLSKELETLEWYMQLENLRMPYPFRYTIDIEKGIDPQYTFVPPNMLQPFIENAIKHGLYSKSEPGNISLKIQMKGDDLHIIIEDDGVGRKAVSQIQQQHILKPQSLGMKITEERLSLLNRKKNTKAAFKIVDLFKNNVPAGTLVELDLPFES